MDERRARHTIVAEPGHRVVLDVDDYLTGPQVDEIRRHLQSRFPLSRFVVVEAEAV